MTDADVAFLTTVYNLKDEKRTGWQRRDISYPESVAAHTFGTAFLTWYLAPDDIDTDQAIRMALAHDLHESLSGDIPSGGLNDDEKAEKESAEREAFQQLVAAAPGTTDELQDAWDAYEERDTAESRFVKDMDLLDMVLQAYIYDREERYPDEETFYAEHDGMDEFFDYAIPRFAHDRPKQIAQQLRQRYREANNQ